MSNPGALGGTGGPGDPGSAGDPGKGVKRKAEEPLRVPKPLVELPVPVAAIISKYADNLVLGYAQHLADPRAEKTKQFKQLKTRYEEIPAVVPAATPPREPEKDPKKLAKAGVARNLKAFATDHEIVPSNFTYTGKWTTEGIASGLRYKADQRALELLNQLSQRMISVLKDSQEVESMAVNNRILVSANESKSVAGILAMNLHQLIGREKTILASAKEKDFERDKREKLEGIADVLMATEKEPATDANMQRFARLLFDVGNHSEQQNAMTSILETLKSTLTNKSSILDGGTVAAAAGLITSAAGLNRIITVPALETKKLDVCAHAEQNLLYALVLSGHQGGAYIAGGKRPCTVCWLSLMLVNDAGYHVTFNPHPGGYWTGTTNDGLHRIAAHLGYSEPALLNRVNELVDTSFTQYVTDLDPDAEVFTDVDLLKSVNEKLHSTDTTTPPNSPEDDSVFHPED